LKVSTSQTIKVPPQGVLMGTRNPIPHASILDSEGACSSELQCERDRGQERVAGD